MGTSEYMKIISLPCSYQQTFDLCLQSVALFDSAKIESADNTKGILIFTEPNLVLSEMPYSQHRILCTVRRINAKETSVEIISKSISFSYMAFGIDANQENVNRIITFFKEQTLFGKNESSQINYRISNPFIIACFSIIPGLGQYWNDQIKKGVMILIIASFSALIAPVFVIVWWGLGIADAFFVANRKNRANIKMIPMDKKLVLTYIFISIFVLTSSFIGWLLLHGRTIF
jgi:hypothetical protein